VCGEVVSDDPWLGNTGSMPDLPYLSAHDVLDLFRRGDLSPMEHLESSIEQIETHDPVLNAVVDRRYA
jgi:Asp-tRNA(Asn)/Glu-tRNA(Gln) amidotransferase A subunit family amidase